MNPETAWRHERENVDQLLARMASDPDFKYLLAHDPSSVIGDSYDAVPNDAPPQRSVDPSRRVALPERRAPTRRAA